MPDFLLEIGTEEIPARMIEAASQELRERIAKLLERERLPVTGQITHVDTPRRLAVIATGIPAMQPDLIEPIVGPALSVAYNMDSRPRPLRRSRRRLVWMLASSAKPPRRRVSILLRCSPKRAVLLLKFLRKRCPKKSLESSGPRACIGGSRASASCALCAGW